MKWAYCIQPYPCPKCGHTNVVSVQSETTYAENISKTAYEYEQQVKLYNDEVRAATYRLNGQKRIVPLKVPTPPKKPNLPKQMMVCMCCVTKCRNIVDGRGCHHCSSLVKNGIQVPFNSRKGKCECGFCSCPCRIMFCQKCMADNCCRDRNREDGRHNEKKHNKPFTSDSEGERI